MSSLGCLPRALRPGWGGEGEGSCLQAGKAESGGPALPSPSQLPPGLPIPAEWGQGGKRERGPLRGAQVRHLPKAATVTASRSRGGLPQTAALASPGSPGTPASSPPASAPAFTPVLHLTRSHPRPDLRPRLSPTRAPALLSPMPSPNPTPAAVLAPASLTAPAQRLLYPASATQDLWPKARTLGSTTRSFVPGPSLGVGAQA